MEMRITTVKSTSLLPLAMQKLQAPTFLPPLPDSTFRFAKISHPHENNRLQNPSSLPNNPLFLHHTKQIHAHLIKTDFNPTYKFSLPPFTPQYISPQAFCNLLIMCYINSNEPRKSVYIYAYLRNADFEVDNFTVPSVLKACSQISMSQLGKEIHGFAIKNGMFGDVFICNALMQMYSECGSLASARLLFDTMPERDVVSWSTMIRSYSRNRMFHEGLEIIKDMRSCDVKPSAVAMVSMANLFADLENVELGKALHAYVLRNGAEEKAGLALVTSLIDMYAKTGNLTSARILFDGLNKRSIVSWTALISGYIRYNDLEEGERLFIEMIKESIFPNEVTMLSMIIACGFVGAIDLGRRLHAYILRNGYKMKLALGTALVDMYGKCGNLRSAKALFDSLEHKDVMTWTAMISAYAQGRRIDEAFDLFVQMKDCKVMPNEVTLVNLLSLSAEAGALDMGKWIHAYIDKQGVDVDMVLKTALIDMYAKCGDINGAQRLFHEAKFRDICMWNAMMAGYGMHGCGDEALKLFMQMERLHIKPNDITFVGSLHACSHAGLVTEGEKLFERMVHDFGLNPKVEHYGCIVDLLGRAGRLYEAYQIIQRMPMTPNITIWGALLAACKLHKNPNLGELAARELLALEPQNCGYNVLMSNIYAAAKRWNDVAGVRKALRDTGIKKEPGISSIEINGSVHDFTMGDASHPQIGKISKMLDEMCKKIKEAGYMPDTSVVLQNIDEEEKETALNHHSEKLAMAFGLIRTAPGTPIRVVKNLRICDDCHTATKLLSKVYERIIIVRDRNRFHHFKGGLCSCGDYW